jgi:small-conductance mechanosensitive channel
MKYLKADTRIADLFEKGFRVGVILLVIIIALITVKIPLTIFAFLGGALAIGVGFGAQNLINNFISGIILLFERPIKVGDIIEVEDTRGRVVTIGGRCSRVRRFDGIDILVPNSSFLEKNVVNWTLTDEVVRLSVSVGVAYGSPTQQVSDLMAGAAEAHEKILKQPQPVVLFEDFGDNALLFTIYFWSEVSPWMDFRIVASELRHEIDKLFAKAGITIAFPQRDVHLDSPTPIQVQIAKPSAPQSNASE